MREGGDDLIELKKTSKTLPSYSLPTIAAMIDTNDENTQALSGFINPSYQRIRTNKRLNGRSSEKPSVATDTVAAAEVSEVLSISSFLQQPRCSINQIMCQPICESHHSNNDIMILEKRLHRHPSLLSSSHSNSAVKECGPIRMAHSIHHSHPPPLPLPLHRTSLLSPSEESVKRIVRKQHVTQFQDTDVMRKDINLKTLFKQIFQ